MPDVQAEVLEQVARVITAAGANVLPSRLDVSRAVEIKRIGYERERPGRPKLPKDLPRERRLRP